MADGDTARDLRERTKELNALRACAKLLLAPTTPICELLQRVADLLPPAMQFPEVAVGRVAHGILTTAAMLPARRLSAPFRTSDGVAGVVEVAYTEHLPFLDEEQALLDSFADLLQAALDRSIVDEEHRRAKEVLDLALRAGIAGVWEWDVDQRRVRWSSHLAELVGHAGEMEGDRGTFAGLIHPDDQAGLDAALIAAAHGGPGTCEVEYRLAHPSGGYRRMAGRICVTVDAHGTRRVIGVASDVTARRLLEERVRHGQRIEAMGQLAAGVAHDFGNLLAVVMMNGEQLRLDLPRDEVVQLGTEIVDASQKGVALIRQLMGLCRRSEFRPHALDLNALVLSHEAMLRRLAGKQVRLDLALAPSVGAVWADETGLHEVVMNLVGNARDAMPTGGTVTIATGRDGDAHAFLEVRDTGVGIPEDQLDHIFTPFYTTKAVGQGTGLGLAVVASVVEQAKGHVSVVSVPGSGTTFRVHLPRHA